MQHADAIGGKIRRFAISVIVVLVVGFVIVHFVKSFHEGRLADVTERSNTIAPLVDTITVQASPSTLALTLPGETAAWYESVIYARVDGYVKKWSADIGDHVKKGQVLATIETPELDAQLTATNAKLVAAKADAAFAATTYKRWRDSPKGVVSEQEREEKKADYTRAMAQVALNKADVDRYLALTKFKQVTAPFDGIVTERRIDIGNLVTAGSSANTTLLYRVSQNNPIRVFADVPQNAASSIKAGLKAEINLQGKIFSGKVVRTADAINPQSRTLKVEVDIPNLRHLLVPGMYVDISYEVPSMGLVQVPAAALIFRSSGPEVAVVSKDYHISFQKVDIARDDGNWVEVSSGVSAGDILALNISNQIVEGQSVHIADSSQSISDAPAHKQ